MGSRTVVDRPLAVVSAVNTTPVTYWVSVDHLNRPIKMTTTTKASVWDAIWQPWGGVHSIVGTASYDARFPGQWFQIESGLHYNWHRSYDPTLGRYTQPDPLGFVDGPSVYGYVKGQPLALTDPEGLGSTLCPPGSRPNINGNIVTCVPNPSDPTPGCPNGDCVVLPNCDCMKQCVEKKRKESNARLCKYIATVFGLVTGVPGTGLVCQANNEYIKLTCAYRECKGK